MKYVSILRIDPAGSVATLVLHPDGSIGVLGVLPHGWTFKPATREDAIALANHLMPEKADGQCG